MLYICTLSQASIYLDLLSSLPMLSFFFGKNVNHVPVLVIADIYRILYVL